MHDTACMGVSERIGKLGAVSKDSFDRQTARGDQLAQGTSFYPLHGDVDGVVAVADLENRAYVGMVERRRQARFLDQASPSPRVGNCLGGKHLDGHVAAKARVAGAVNDTHTAFAKQFKNRVGTDTLCHSAETIARN